jgi:hypothetical protein
MLTGLKPTDGPIAACGGNVRDAVKALIVANGFLEMEMKQLQPPSRMVTRVASLNPCRATCAISFAGTPTIQPVPLMCMAVRSRR